MDRHEQAASSQLSAAASPAHKGQVAAPSEFVCPGCGRPLAITLHSTMCFAEALVYCPDCERDYQQRRGQWVVDGGGPRPD